MLQRVNARLAAAACVAAVAAGPAYGGIIAYCNDILPPCPQDVDYSGQVDIHDLLAVLRNWGAGDGVIRPWGDANGDCTVDLLDISHIIFAYGFVCDGTVTGACMQVDGTCTVLSWDDCNSASGFFHETAGCADTDGDGLPDAFELDDCAQHAFPFSGSDPTLTDTDGDDLSDKDETLPTTGGLYLPGFGCNPCHRDILIQVDWVYATAAANPDANQLHQGQIDRIYTAFQTSHLNPDGSTGTNVIIDLGDAIEDPSGDDELNMGPSGSTFETGEFAIIKASNFNSSRLGYFHYCLMCDSYARDGASTSSSGVGEMPGDDFLVAMGQYTTGDDDWIGNTFMHEFGHNLGLNHGGDESRNYKPNYSSIMNYTYQFCGADTDGDGIGDGALDFAWDTHPDLNENDLDEAAGLTGDGPWIDWNMDGLVDAPGLVQNINCDWGFCGGEVVYSVTCGASDDECDDTTCNTLTDYHDWDNLNFTGITTGLAPRQVIECTNVPPGAGR